MQSRHTLHSDKKYLKQSLIGSDAGGSGGLGEGGADTISNYSASSYTLAASAGLGGGGSTGGGSVVSGGVQLSHSATSGNILQPPGYTAKSGATGTFDVRSTSSNELARMATAAMTGTGAAAAGGAATGAGWANTVLDLII